LKEKQSKEYESSLENWAELKACAKNPIYFLSKYAWIQNKNTGKTVKWEPWDYQLDLLDDFLAHRELIILKARQLGISWLVAGYGLWKALSNDSAKILFLSQGEEEAWDMISKAKFIYLHLPEFLRNFAPLRLDSRSTLTFEGMHSELKALPSTEKAGRGTDATLVVRDECAYHPYAEENFSAISPAIDSGGQQIDLSTRSIDLNSHFLQRFRKAMDGGNIKYIFLGWKKRPVRTEGVELGEWFENQIKPKYSIEELAREYPETLEEALRAPKTMCRFDTSALDAMKTECDSPMREEWNGYVKIYRESVPGRNYCFCIDPSEGTYDPSLGVVVDADTHEEVAKYHGKIPLDEQARISYELYKRYNEAYLAPERNASGLTLINMLVDMGITNWYFSDSAREKPGWWTSSTTRKYMIQDLAEMIRLRQLRIYDEIEINEFLSFIRTDKHPDGIASGGTHDEAPIAWGIYTQIRSSVPMGIMRATTGKYKV